MLTRGQRQIMTAEKISKLLLLRMMGQISPSEWEELNTWLSEQDVATQEYIEQITDRSWIEGDLLNFVCIDVETAFADVQKRISQSD
jgi:hypothetical protein